MKNQLYFFISTVLLGFALPVHAQTAPTTKGKTHLAKQGAKSAERDSSKTLASNYPYLLKDTARFNRRLRRSSRPSQLPTPARPIKK
ncbi:hypothetical protein P1X16_22675 [Hymenobacter sp. YC55]|nr:hypothetical protein [Hymenobacter sp. YC55]